MVICHFKKMITAGLLAFVFIFLLPVTPVQTQGLLPTAAKEGIVKNFEGTTGVKVDKEGNKRTILNFAVNIINWALTLISIIFVVFLVYAGFRYMTAGADAAPREDAIRTIKSAVVGLAIVLSAFSITKFVIGTFVKPPSATPYPDRVAGTIEVLLDR